MYCRTMWTLHTGMVQIHMNYSINKLFFLSFFNSLCGTILLELVVELQCVSLWKTFLFQDQFTTLFATIVHRKLCDILLLVTFVLCV